jgi:hypothetical protein
LRRRFACERASRFANCFDNRACLPIFRFPRAMPHLIPHPIPHLSGARLW